MSNRQTISANVANYFLDFFAILAKNSAAGDKNLQSLK
jgi:hypothetical protein